MIIPKKCLIGCCFLCILLVEVQAQSTTIDNNAHIYSGRAYVGLRARLVGSVWVGGHHSLLGGIRFNDVDYDSVRIGYDLMRDEVVMTNPNEQLLTPAQENVQAFSLEDRQFHRLIGEERLLTGLPNQGFYELLYDRDGTKLLVKRRGVLKENHEQHYLRFSVVRSDSYYLVKGGHAFPLVGRLSIYRVYPTAKREAKRFARQRQLDFKHDFERALLETLIFCEDIH
ncbi:hypothetical protein [Parapedobacter pyrenivorans]|uniref:hypothetical protein n=1 Tax=Parapedobacter pyrenivorans TaxID=1305674 RepID=UPI0033414605